MHLPLHEQKQKPSSINNYVSGGFCIKLSLGGGEGRKVGREQGIIPPKTVACEPAALIKRACTALPRQL